MGTTRRVLITVVVYFVLTARKHNCAPSRRAHHHATNSGTRRSDATGTAQSPEESGPRPCWEADRGESRLNGGPSSDDNNNNNTSASRHERRPPLVSSQTAAARGASPPSTLRAAVGKKESKENPRRSTRPRITKSRSTPEYLYHSLRFSPHKVSSYLTSSSSSPGSRRVNVISVKKWKETVSARFPGISTDNHVSVSDMEQVDNDYGRCESTIQHTCPRGLRGSRCSGRFYHVCWCCNTTVGLVANCSGINERHIPSLPDGVEGLDFTHNHLAHIDSSFFQNVRTLKYVDLSSNSLVSLDENAFAPLHNLTELVMDNNIQLAIRKPVSAAFKIYSLEKLSLNGVIADSLPPGTFDNLTRLRCLFLVGVNLRQWNASVFQVMRSLQRLSLGENDLRYISMENVVDTFNLTWLDLGNNDMYEFPKTCHRSGNVSIFPNLRRLNLTSNRISQINVSICLPSLSTLDLSANEIRHLAANMFGSDRFPNLVTLHIERLHVWRTESFAFNNTSLRYLSLMYNYIDFVNEHVSPDSFHGLPNLLFLQLDQNYLNNEIFIAFFKHLRTLIAVYIGNTYFDEVTLETFASFPYLVNVTMHRNFFWRLPDGVFDHLKRLKRLDLSNSKITTIGENTFGADLRARLVHLDLSGNNFICNCDLLWFRDWLRKCNKTFRYSWTEYRCSNAKGTRVVDFNMTLQVCLFSHGASESIIGIMVSLMAILMLVAIVFRYRWHIRLRLYETFRGRSHNNGLPDNYFRYDLFVCYADEDLAWIINHLIPEMEARQGRRLCIHQRDFTPGENIVDNIFCSVHASRRVLMVFSRHFARSQWCQFELSLSLSHVVDIGDTLLVVCVDDVTSGGDMTPTMTAVMHTTTYIEWTEGADARATFWDRLKLCLR